MSEKKSSQIYVPIEEQYNLIQPAYENHYFVILVLDEDSDILKLIDHSYKYVWIIDHSEHYSWEPSNNVIYSQQSDPNKVWVRNDNMEVLMETEYFCESIKKELAPNHGLHLHIIQTNVVPPSFLSLDKFKNKKRYDMLKQHIDYLFDLEVHNEEAVIISSKREVIENFLKEIGKLRN